MIVPVPIKVTTTGSAGSATGSGYSAGPIKGLVRGVYCDYHASAPATTDLTLRTKGGGPPSYNLFVATNVNTDFFATIASKPVDNANAAITNAHVPFPVSDYLEVALAQCDALADAVVVHVLVEVDE